MRLTILYSVVLFTLLSLNYSFAQYSVDNLPNPKDRGQSHFVSNPDGILSSYTVQSLDQQAQEIDSLTSAEYAIVVVNDYVGDSDFEFALALFNKWGIGKRDANNGLLLFIAKDRREYRFISGYGMERIFPDAYLKRVGEKYLVPNFRNEDYDQGVKEASDFIAQILKSPDSIKELEALMPEAIPFWSFKNPILINCLLIFGVFFILYIFVHLVSRNILSDKNKKPPLYVPIFWGLGCMGLLMFITLFIFAFVFKNVEEVYQVKNTPYFILVLCLLILAMKISNGRTMILESFKDEEDLHRALKKYIGLLCIPMLLTPLAWIDLFTVFRRFSKNKGRFTPPDQSGYWERINRSDKGAKPASYLDKGQKREEDIKSVRYEIWKNKKSGTIELVAWEHDKHFVSCPSCTYRTLELNQTKTIVAATYSSSGEGEKFDKCRNCNYLLSKGTFVIPKKVRSSSSSSSSGGSGGGGSSSGGGSFGGGSSGGGGAGGRW